MYIEASNNVNTGPFTLTSSTFVECVGEVSFYYHMWGFYMGTLELEETTDSVSWSTIWTKSGDQGDSWQGASVSIATINVIQVRWVGTTGADLRSDMAIDDVEIRSDASGVCTLPTPVPTPLPTALPMPAPTPVPTRMPCEWLSVPASPRLALAEFSPSGAKVLLSFDAATNRAGFGGQDFDCDALVEFPAASAATLLTAR